MEDICQWCGKRFQCEWRQNMNLWSTLSSCCLMRMNIMSHKSTIFFCNLKSILRIFTSAITLSLLWIPVTSKDSSLSRSSKVLTTWCVLKEYIWTRHLVCGLKVPGCGSVCTARSCRFPSWESFWALSVATGWFELKTTGSVCFQWRHSDAYKLTLWQQEGVASQSYQIPFHDICLCEVSQGCE